MSRARHKINAPSADREFLAFDKVCVRLGERNVFNNTNWIWRAGEQWALLGPDGSGKSLLVEVLLGRAILSTGEVRGPFAKSGSDDVQAIACVSPQIQRELAMHESSFYQLRWHSGLEHGPRTVAEFFSQESVEDHNPFEVGFHLSHRREFLHLRWQFVDWLGIKCLWRRNLLHLSNGEMRKTLLVHALLKSPSLLVLEDAYAGLDAATPINWKWGEVRTRT